MLQLLKIKVCGKKDSWQAQKSQKWIGKLYDTYQKQCGESTENTKTKGDLRKYHNFVKLARAFSKLQYE